MPERALIARASRTSPSTRAGEVVNKIRVGLLLLGVFAFSFAIVTYMRVPVFIPDYPEDTGNIAGQYDGEVQRIP